MRLLCTMCFVPCVLTACASDAFILHAARQLATRARVGHHSASRGGRAEELHLRLPRYRSPLCISHLSDIMRTCPTPPHPHTRASTPPPQHMTILSISNRSGRGSMGSVRMCARGRSVRPPSQRLCVCLYRHLGTLCTIFTHLHPDFDPCQSISPPTTYPLSLPQARAR